MSWPRALAALLSGAVVGAALAGCAAPRYQVIARYEGPTDPAGRACVERCQQGLADCQDRCRARYQACLKEIEPQAEAHYVEVLERYVAHLQAYRDALDRYQYDVWVGWGHDPWWLGHGWHGPWYRPWPGPAYYPWPPPPVPDRATELARYRQRACGGDCGCQPVYDGCFLACGGTKTVETRCVANCPAPAAGAPATEAPATR